MAKKQTAQRACEQCCDDAWRDRSRIDRIDFPEFYKFLQFFGGFVLSCIETKCGAMWLVFSYSYPNRNLNDVNCTRVAGNCQAQRAQLGPHPPCAEERESAEEGEGTGCESQNAEHGDFKS